MDKKKIPLTLLALTIIGIGAIVSMVFDQFLLGVLITVPGFMILPSFNIPKSLAKYSAPVSLGFDIFVLGAWIIVWFSTDKMQSIADLFQVNYLIVLIVMAWFALGLLENFRKNLNEVIHSGKVIK